MSPFRRNEQPHETPENQEEHADTEMQDAERSHVEELTAAFQDSWEKNHREGDPDVSFKFLFSAHEAAQDLSPNLRSELEKADIYMTERIGWTARGMEAWNDVSAGKIDLDSASYPTAYLENMAKALHKSDVVVVSPDLPEGHPLTEQSRALGMKMSSIISLPLPFDEAVQRLDELTHEHTLIMRAREKEIINNIPTLIRNALERNKALQEKDHLNVVLTYGDGHTALYHALFAAGKDVEREVRGIPHHAFTHHDELRRKHLFGVADSEHNMDLVAHGLVSLRLEHTIKNKLRDLGAGTNEMDRVSRLALESLTTDELRDVWNVCLSGDASAALAELERKGFTMPTTREELDEILQSKRK